MPKLRLALFLVLFACRGSAPAGEISVEAAPLSNAWSRVTALPAWVTAKPAPTDRLVFVGEAASNSRSVALLDGGPLVTEQARQLLRQRLGGLLEPAELERVVAAALSSLVLVQRALQEEVLTTELVPGNTLCTAWAMWELPFAAVLVLLPQTVRAEAERRLASSA